MFLAFFGEYRGHEHPHESPAVMIGPLAVLALLSLGGGFSSTCPSFWRRCFRCAEEGDDLGPDGRSRWRSASSASRWPSCSTWLSPACRIDRRQLQRPLQLVYNKYFVDEIYDAAVVKPLVSGSREVLWKGVDAGLIDGAVNGVGIAVARHRRLAASCCNPAIFAATPTWVLFGSVLLLVAMGRDVGRRAMNLLDIVLAIPLVGFLVVLLVPRAAHRSQSARSRSLFALVAFVASLGLAFGFDTMPPASSSSRHRLDRHRPTSTTTSASTA